MKRDELELLHGYLSGTLTVEEFPRLQTLLRESAAARRMLRSLGTVEAKLEEYAAANPITIGLVAAPQARPAAPSLWLTLLAGLSWRPVAGAVVTAGLLWFAWMGGPGPKTPVPFVMLSAANDAVWADPNVELALRAGELPAATLRLEAGAAEFHFVDGATLLLRGPAVVQIPERKRVFVESGRVFVRCPSPKSRLTVVTAETEVEDLGTEFSVEARADRSTRVAVLSGEVRVGKSQAQHLRKGQSAVVRGDGLLAIQPLEQQEFAELLLASPSVNAAVLEGRNLLRDPGFAAGLSESTWSGTEPNLAIERGGGHSGDGVRVSARGYAHWPMCRQTVETGDIAGRLVVATAKAAVATNDPLKPRQSAMLKVVFKNEDGRDFAFALRRFLGPQSKPGAFESVRVGAFAPLGTRRVQVQLMLQSNLQESGSVIFDDVSLLIATPE